MNGKLRAVKVVPDSGTRRFRNRASLRVENRTLIATNRKGVERRFPLDAGPSSPARSVLVSPESDGAFPPQWAILDGNGEAVIVGYVGDWDAWEFEDFEEAAGLKRGIEHRSAPPTVRQDGLILEDGTWWAWAPKAGMVAFVVAGITNAGFLPAVVGWPVAGALTVFLVVGMTSGAYGKHREVVGAAAAEEAIAAGGDEAYKKAREAYKKASEEARNQPPEPETPEGAT
jgi:hypothetical protein